MSTDILVRHCAPTLAGIKIGNLVSYCFKDLHTLNKEIRSKNKLLNSKGLYFVVLKIKGKNALVYVYRKKLLEKILEKEDIREFLGKMGYVDFDFKTCFEVLKKHLLNKDFPHEVGVFLGYPLEDIKAFIENKGANFKVLGCWKSYFNEDEAVKTFAKYKKCTKIYCEKFAEGLDITRLAVAV